MSKIKLGAKEYEALWCESGHGFIDGVDRQTITVQLPVDAEKFDALNDTLSDPTFTNIITLENVDTGIPGSVAMQVFEGYTVKQEVAIRPFQVGFNDIGIPVVEDHIVFVMSRKSPLELQMDQVMELLKNAGITK